jgi:hypothetical protein
VPCRPARLPCDPGTSELFGTKAISRQEISAGHIINDPSISYLCIIGDNSLSSLMPALGRQNFA